VYPIRDSVELLRGVRRLRRRGEVSRTVVLLGFTSLLTDVSSEMVAAVLPLYLVYSLGLSPLQYGVVDGIHQGASAVVRVAAGYGSDRWGRHKEVASAGYALSAVSRLGLLAVASWSALSAVVFVDRIGKGIRTAPRDALISLSTEERHLGAAFGVHRAMDTAGAMIGPLLAFGLLTLLPGDFNAIFVVSFCAALAGLGVIVLLVENQPVAGNAGGLGELRPPSVRAAAGLFAIRRFRALVLLASALAVTTLSDGFLYVGLQKRIDFDPSLFPLLYTGTALSYMLLAVPLGRLADRVGRLHVFVGGYAILILVYTSLLLPSLPVALLVCYLVVLGAFYAATDGVLMAVAAAMLPERLRATGLGLLVTATSTGRLVASVAFGALWTWLGLVTAVIVMAVGLGLTTLGAAVVLARTGKDSGQADVPATS
jgi:MFS family permease